MQAKTRTQRQTLTVFPIVWNSKAPLFCRKAHKISARFFFSKSTIILAKSTQLLTPKQISLHFLHSFFKDFELCPFISFLMMAFKKKSDFRKAQKFFVRRHLTFKKVHQCALKRTQLGTLDPELDLEISTTSNTMLNILRLRLGQ